jgi:hypothetical protein
MHNYSWNLSVSLQYFDNHPIFICTYYVRNHLAQVVLIYWTENKFIVVTTMNLF